MRVAAVGALVGALGWTASSIVAVYYGVEPPYGIVGSLPWQLIESFDAIAEVGMVVALVGLYVRQSDVFGWAGRIGFVLTAGAAASWAISTILWLGNPAGQSVFVDVFFFAGVFGTIVGYPILGYSTYRAERFPRWLGVLLGSYTGFAVLTIYLLDFTGGARILMGLPWLAVGYVLWGEGNRLATEVSSPR